VAPSACRHEGKCPTHQPKFSLRSSSFRLARVCKDGREGSDQTRVVFASSILRQRIGMPDLSMRRHSGVGLEWCKPGLSISKAFRSAPKGPARRISFSIRGGRGARVRDMYAFASCVRSTAAARRS